MALSQKCSSNGGSTRASHRSAGMCASSLSGANVDNSFFQAQCPQTRVTPVVHIDWQTRRKIICTYRADSSEAAQFKDGGPSASMHSLLCLPCGTHLLPIPRAGLHVTARAPLVPSCRVFQSYPMIWPVSKLIIIYHYVLHQMSPWRYDHFLQCQ